MKKIYFTPEMEIIDIKTNQYLLAGSGTVPFGGNEDPFVSPEDPDDVSVFVEELISNLENLRDTCQESLDNIPEQLQEGNSGQILQERIENLDGVISELENIDTEFSSELDESEKDGMSQEEWERQEEDEKEKWIADKIGEINDAGLDFE